MSTPAQSLTSLDWYRQALEESAKGRRGAWVRWLRGLSFLLFHLSLYALSVVVLFAIDLIRTPASLWIDNVALAWAALLVIHAAIVGLIWAIGLLREDNSIEQDELRWSSTSNLSGWRAKPEEPQDAVFRMSSPDTGIEDLPGIIPTHPTQSPVQSAPLANGNRSSTGTPAATTSVTSGASSPFESWSSVKPAASAPSARPEPTGEAAPPPSDSGKDSLWSGWEPASPATIARRALEGDPSEDRASWQEASAAAWLTHASGPTVPSSEPDTFKQQLRARLERRNAERATAQKSSDEEGSGLPPQ